MLNFCNKTNTTVFVAIMFHDDDECAGYGDWRTRGWWRLAPGETKSVLSLPLFHNRYYYYYAKGNDGRVWEGTYGGGVYVYSEAFDSCIDIGSTAASDVVGMRQLDIGWEITSYTLNLTG